MEDRDPDDDRIKQTELEDLRKALQHSVLKIILQEDRLHQTRTSMDAISALTELTFQFAAKALVPDLYAFSTHANRKSTISAEDVALVLRKLPPRQMDAFKSVFCRSSGATANNTDSNTFNRNRTADESSNIAPTRRQPKSSMTGPIREPSLATNRNRKEIVLSSSSSSSSSAAEEEENKGMDAGKRKAIAIKEKLPERSKLAPLRNPHSRRIGTNNLATAKEQRESLLSKFALAPNLDSDSSSSSSSSSLMDDNISKARRNGGRLVSTASRNVRADSSRAIETAQSSVTVSNFATKKRRRLTTEDSLLQESSDEEHIFGKTNVGRRIQSKSNPCSNDPMVEINVDRPIAGTTARRLKDPLDGDCSVVDAVLENLPPENNRIASRGAKSGFNDVSDNNGDRNKVAASPIEGRSRHSQVALTLANLSDSGMSEANETDNETNVEANSDVREELKGRSHIDGPVHVRTARRPAIDSDDDD
jgi:histone H3/H4